MIKEVILINSEAFFVATTTPRTSKHVDLKFPSGTVSSKAKVKRLSIAYVQFFLFLFSFLMIIDLFFLL